MKLYTKVYRALSRLISSGVNRFIRWREYCQVHRMVRTTPDWVFTPTSTFRPQPDARSDSLPYVLPNIPNPPARGAEIRVELKSGLRIPHCQIVRGRNPWYAYEQERLENEKAGRIEVKS